MSPNTHSAVFPQGFRLYEKFRPSVASGKAGWGAKGVLDLDAIEAVDDAQPIVYYYIVCVSRVSSKLRRCFVTSVDDLGENFVR